MPNVTLTISTPILQAGEVFRTRYRLLPNGAYTANVDRDNNPFTLVGLVPGQYEMEVVLVKADGTVCEAVIKPFDVVSDYACSAFTPQIIQSGNLFYLRLSYAGVTNPPCGFHIKITGNSNNKIINYSPLPTSPLDIPIANEALNVQVIADLCNQKTLTCLDADMTAIETACTPLILNTATITFTKYYPNGSPGFLITLSYTNSTPPSNYLTLRCDQINVLSGAPAVVYFPNYTFGWLASTSTSVSFPIIANPAVFANKYHFTGYIIDVCGKKHTFSVTADLS